jgi:hypothetical protein
MWANTATELKMEKVGSCFRTEVFTQASSLMIYPMELETFSTLIKTNISDNLSREKRKERATIILVRELSLLAHGIMTLKLRENLFCLTVISLEENFKIIKDSKEFINIEMVIFTKAVGMKI